MTFRERWPNTYEAILVLVSVVVIIGGVLAVVVVSALLFGNPAYGAILILFVGMPTMLIGSGIIADRRRQKRSKNRGAE